MIDPNRIADIFMAVVLVLMAAINMYEMMAKEMAISLHCPNYIDISRLRPEKGQKDDAS